jgi:hypothetical protein
MELDNWIRFHIGHVQFTFLVLHVRMLFQHIPSKVSIEHTSFYVMRIRIGLCELVMDPMVPNPFVQGVLKKSKITLKHVNIVQLCSTHMPGGCE